MNPRTNRFYRDASNCDAPLDPACARDAELQAERADMFVDVLIRIPAFLAVATQEINGAECGELVASMARADYTAVGNLYARVARRVANTEIDQLIRLTHPMPQPRDQAAREVLKRYTDPLRSAAIPLAASPGAAAERSIPVAPAGSVTPTAGAFLSTDRSKAA